MVEMPGGGGLKRPRIKLGCSAKEDDDEEERKKERRKERRIWVKKIGRLYKHTLIFTTSLAEIRLISIKVLRHITFPSLYQNAKHKEAVKCSEVLGLLLQR
jgi:hypothetical protein